MLYTDGTKFTEPGQTMRDQITKGAISVSPPVGLSIWNELAAIPASQWLTYLAILYTLLQTFVIIRDQIIRRNAK